MPNKRMEAQSRILLVLCAVDVSLGFDYAHT